MGINRHTLYLYWQQIKHHRVSGGLAIVLVPFGTIVIDVVLPYIASQAIGAMTRHDIAAAQQYVGWSALAVLVGATANLIGFQALIRHESSVVLRLFSATFTSLLHKEAQFFSNQKVGAMTSKFIDFVRSEVTLQDLLVIRTLGFVLSMSVGLTILALQMWPLALLLGGFIVLLILQVKWSIRHRKYWRESRRKIRAEMHGDVADALTNNLIVKTFAKEDGEIAHITQLNKAYKHAYMKDIGFTSKEGSLRVFLMGVVQVVAIGLCVYFVSRGELEIAIAVFILAYMQRIGSQIFTLGEMLNGYDQALLDAEPMSRMLTHTNKINDEPRAPKLTVDHPSIDFVNVHYRYDDGDEDVLRDINVRITAGQKVGLVGASGAGKTTMSHLLLRFDDVTHGEIRIDGQDIAQVTQKSLREHIAFVPQEPMLFHRSLRENIAYGKPGASTEEITEAAKKAHAWEFIDRLPNKLDTFVGERGVKLSGGQRQRIAIARAILKDSPILLLDEATSALDSESEKLIQASLDKLMQGRTSIVIAHRLSTIAKLDRIVVLDDGKVVEDGSHADLLKLGGIYATLWTHQSGGFIDEEAL